MSKEFHGNLKELILYMIQNGTDCCEVTNTVGETSVTLDVTITKIVEGNTVIYDASKEDPEVVPFDEDDIGYLS